VKRLWRWWLWKLCRQVGVYPVPVARLRRADAILEDLYWFTETSGFLRDGRYPGGRHAERRIMGLVDALDDELGFMPRGTGTGFDFARNDMLLTDGGVSATLH
jgi:hypothetical protein